MIYATSLLSRSSTAIAHIQAAQQQVLQAQYDIASGSSITVGSDDPVAAALALRTRASLSRLDTWIANIDLASGRQTAMDNALQEISEVLSSASVIANQGASSATLTDVSAAALAEEVESLFSRLANLANSEVGGSYLFGGTATESPPFIVAGDTVTYAGASGTQTVAISSTLSTATALHGAAILLSPQDAFAILVDLRDALLAGDQATTSAALSRIEAASAVVYQAQTRIGAAAKQAESVRGILDGIRIAQRSDLSTAADTDMAEAAVRLSAAEVAYEAALQVATRIADPTLLDFL